MNKGIEILLFVLLLTLPNLFAQVNSNDIIKGESLFRKNCASCHNVHKEFTGPMLASITKKRSKEWLTSFINNSQNVILSKDEYANHLFEQYNHTVMPSFNHLSEYDINQILLYIESESKVAVKPPSLEYLNEMKGKTLFRNHCETCHSLNSEAYGPSLGSIYRRRPKPWIIKFVTNSQSVIRSGDPYAANLFKNFDNKIMPPFYFLDSAAIIDIVKYIDVASKSEPHIAGVNGNKLSIGKENHSHASFQMHPSLPILGQDGIFGKISLCAVTVIAGYIFFIIIRMLYKNLNKY